MYSRGDASLFRPLVDSLMETDDYLVLEDYDDYLARQSAAADAYRNSESWTRMSIFNVARSACFSSDRAIRQYCDRIWHAVPVPVAP